MDDAKIQVPVTPFEVSDDVDLNDPIERCRDPRIKVHKGPPARRAATVQEKKANPRGIHPRMRRIQYPELFELRFSVGLIESMHREHGEPAACRVWIDEVIASGVPENQRRKFLVTKHPAFPQYWALFEQVSNPKHGPSYKTTSIFKESSEGYAEDYLPAALQSVDRRWDHLRGRFGEPREPTRRDFEIIRETADRRAMSATAIGAKLMQPQAAAYSERQRQEDDYVHEMHDYTFRMAQQAANNGTKQWSNATVVPHENEERWYVEQRNGYQVKVNRRNSRLVDELTRARETAVEERATKFVERDAKERSKEELLERARRIHLGKNQKVARKI